MTAITGTWDDHGEGWGDASAIYAKKYPVVGFGTAFYQLEYGGVFAAGANVQVLLERTGLTVFGRDRAGLYKSDPSLFKKIIGLWPIITGTEGDIIQVSCGSHEHPRGPVTWEGPYNFTIGSSKFIDFIYVVGPYLAVKFESSGMSPWRLLGYDLDIEPVGEH